MEGQPPQDLEDDPWWQATISSVVDVTMQVITNQAWAIPTLVDGDSEDDASDSDAPGCCYDWNGRIPDTSKHFALLSFAGKLRYFPDPVFLVSTQASQVKRIQCPCTYDCPNTARYRFKSYHALKRHARRMDTQNVTNFHTVLDLFLQLLFDHIRGHPPPPWFM
jgi:hypothetical protein